MIEHNLFEMENYRELIDEVGVDKFRERFEELQKTAMEFIEMAGFSETAYCNERILMQVILDYFMDVMRLKEFHSIERIRTEKLFAYTISWIVRRKPIQFRDYSEEERDIFINERFAAYLLVNVWNETFCAGSLCGKVSRIYRNAAILFQIPSVRSKDIRTFDRVI